MDIKYGNVVLLLKAEMLRCLSLSVIFVLLTLIPSYRELLSSSTRF